MNYLLTISIGPVQEFISSARRSRDLWFGSWLLSELSKAAAKQLGKDNLIFPSVASDKDLTEDSDFNVVNKILAIVDGNKEKVETLCKAVDVAIKDRLNTLSKNAFDRIQPRTQNHFHREVAVEQLKDLVEFYWASIPLGENYAETRHKVENLLAARKTTRDFTKIRWHSNDLYVPKSSLDGQRESVIDEGAYKRLSKDELYKQFGVREGERLCGVGLFKRHGNKKGYDSFLSTSHIAALPLLAKLRDKQATDSYVKVLGVCGLNEKNGLNQIPLSLFPNEKPHAAFGQLDGHLLFEERLGDYFDTSNSEGSENLKKAKKALGCFLKTALNNQRPIPYYGILQADGDRMGKAIDHESKQGQERHKQLSKSLSAFASTVRGIVQSEESQGCLVYAGGDDVLALVPLHTAIDCARKLAVAFRSEMKGFHDEDGKQPTLSVGVAIAHHLDPLSDALELARQSERNAKSVHGKDALAITISKRSGVDFTVKGRWGKVDIRIQRFAELYLREMIPNGAAYELRQLSQDLSALPREAITNEALRILRRKRVKDKIIRDDILKEIELHLNDPDLSIGDLANELIAARIFFRAMKQAGVVPKNYNDIDEKGANVE